MPRGLRHLFASFIVWPTGHAEATIASEDVDVKALRFDSLEAFCAGFEAFLDDLGAVCRSAGVAWP